MSQQHVEINHSGGWPRKHNRWQEAWWVLTGRFTLHKAWQAGYDHRSQHNMAAAIRTAGIAKERA